MKRTFLFLSIILPILTGNMGCQSSNNQSNDFITVDVIKNYPQKELILQDFVDVEYIPLETNDEFINQSILLDVGKNILILKNRVNDGDIFIYDREGKAIKKINRRGQGDEEYLNILSITLDEYNSEMFINASSLRKIIVYDLEGNFKRRFNHKEDAMYNKIYNFDQNNLICYDGASNSSVQTISIISKQDGSVTKEIPIPFEKKRSIRMRLYDETRDMTFSANPSTHYSIIPFHNQMILVEPSSDTIYRYSQTHNMTPFIARTPTIRSMDPETFLFLSILTDRYYFMETVKKEYDFGTNDGFPSVDLVYDKRENALFKYSVYNDDYSNKEQVYMKSTPINNEIITWLPLQPFHLISANKNGQLKGRLKEIATTLDEEDNAVIMLIKHKK